MMHRLLLAAMASTFLFTSGAASAQTGAAKPPFTLATSMIMKEVPAGPYSDYLNLDLASGRLFATPQAAKAIAVLDLKTGNVLNMVSGFGNPHGIFFDARTGRLFVADSALGKVRVFHGADFSQEAEISVEKGADWLTYDPVSDRIYVNNGGDEAGEEYSLISAIDPRSLKKTADIRVETPGLEASFVDGAAGKLYVNLPSTASIAVVDLHSQSVVATWPIGHKGRNMSVTMDKTGKRLFVGCRDDDMNGSIAVLDTNNGAVLATLPIGGWIDSIYFDEHRQRIYGSTGVGFIETYQAISRNQYKRLPRVGTAVMAKTSLYSPALDEMFVSVPHLGSTPAKILVFKPAS